MMNIRILFPGPNNPAHSLRSLEDLQPYQDIGVQLSLSFNVMGPLHCQTSIEESLARPGMAWQAQLAEQEGMDAVVIESMGDTGLFECREAVSIPVVGMSDIAFRVAGMLGRKFGMITAGQWHGYAVERLIRQYDALNQYVGFESIDLQPFFTDATSNQDIHSRIAQSIIKLIAQDADTIVLGGSYFLGLVPAIQKALMDSGYHNIVLMDSFALAIRFARMLVDAKLSHSKKIYANPTKNTPIIGYTALEVLPGLVRQ